MRRLSRCEVRSKSPDGGRCKLYPVSDIEQIAQERVAAAAAAEAKKRAAAEEAAARAAAPPFVVPEGFVARAEARGVLGITPRAFVLWITVGKINFGVSFSSRVGGRCTVYPLKGSQALAGRDAGPGEPVQRGRRNFRSADRMGSPPRGVPDDSAWTRPTWDVVAAPTGCFRVASASTTGRRCIGLRN